MLNTGQSARNWTDPTAFHPERFLDNEQKTSFSYFPFSAGTRNCIGQSMAMCDLKVRRGCCLWFWLCSLLADPVSQAMLALLLQRFEFLPPPADRPELQKKLKFSPVNYLANGFHIGLRVINTPW
jgi:hypothetical protein